LTCLIRVRKGLPWDGTRALSLPFLKKMLNIEKKGLPWDGTRALSLPFLKKMLNIEK
jgi:hypothetical protein